MIEINWTIWLQFANFVVLMFLLNLMLYRPLRAMLARRKQTVEAGHSRARELREQVEEKMARYQQQLQEAKLQGSEEKAALRSGAAKEEAGILGAAQEEASTRLHAIKARVQAEAQKAGEALRVEVSALASDVATKVFGRSL